MVPQSNQIHPIHNLAQLQVDHSQNIIFHFPHPVHCPLFLLSARIHNQEDVGSIKNNSYISTYKYFTPLIYYISFLFSESTEFKPFIHRYNRDTVNYKGCTKIMTKIPERNKNPSRNNSKDF